MKANFVLLCAMLGLLVAIWRRSPWLGAPALLFTAWWIARGIELAQRPARLSRRERKDALRASRRACPHRGAWPECPCLLRPAPAREGALR